MKYIVVNCEHINGEINTPNFLGVYNTEAEARQFIEESIAEGLRVFPEQERLEDEDIIVEHDGYGDVKYYCAWKIIEVEL